MSGNPGWKKIYNSKLLSAAFLQVVTEHIKSFKIILLWIPRSRQYLEPACAMFPTEEFCSCYWENSEFSYDWFIESIGYANWNRSCKVSVLKDYSDNWCLLNPLLKFFKSNEISFAGLSVFCQNELVCICHLFENYKNCLWGWMIWSFHWGVSLSGWGWGILTQGGLGNTGWGKFL